jgi:hypothetical protein
MAKLGTPASDEHAAQIVLPRLRGVQSPHRTTSPDGFLTVRSHLFL